MSINIGPPTVEGLHPRITVIGVGGAGGNAIANMIAAEIEGVDFVVANTDAQALNNSSTEQRVQLGPEITKGLGAGSRPEVGRAAAEETVEEIERLLDGVNMCFIAAGMGGGTGTGAAPVIAETARKMGVLTVGVVTKPFLFEGTRRMRAAEAGIAELQQHVDTLIVIPNQNLFLIAKADTTFKEAFLLADEVLQQGVRSITDLMVMPGLINLDFADVESVMKEAGKAMMGTGEGEGDNRALEAAERAIANPLLEGVSMQGATGVIISIIGGEDMKLLEVDEAANHIRELVDSDANIIWGSAFNPDLDGRIRVSVVATGIDADAAAAPSPISRPLDLAQARGPKKPILPVPGLEETGEEPVPEAAPMPEPEIPEPEPEPVFDAEPASAPLGLSAGYDSEEDDDDDVDEIVDPLAGLRNAEEDEDGFDEGALEDQMSDAANRTDGDGFADGDDDTWDLPASAARDDDDTLELSLGEDDGGDEAGASNGAGGDELLLDASRLAETDEPVGEPQPGGRRRSLLGGGELAGGAGAGASGAGGGGGGGGSGGGSTLFERMANLSRGGSVSSDGDEEDDDDEDGGALNIPRFLGRQNNQ